MPERHPMYYLLKNSSLKNEYQASRALVRYWEHMENVHNATPEDYGVDVLGWHRQHHPECKTLPSYSEAARPG